MSEKEEIKQQIYILRNKLNIIENKEAAKENKALLGKCFKYRNGFSSGEKWWLYCKVVKIKGHDILCETFQVDTRGQCSFDPNSYSRPSAGNGYIPIARIEYQKAWRAFKRKFVSR